MLSIANEAKKIVNSMLKTCDCVDLDLPLQEAINSFNHNYEYSDNDTELLQVLVDHPPIANSFLLLVNKHKGTTIDFNLVNHSIYRTVLELYGETTLADILAY